MHYCMGELVDLDFSHNKDQNCSNCGMKESESNGCCEDEPKWLKIETEHQIADAAFLLPMVTSSPALLNLSFKLTSPNIPPLIEVHPISNAPPRGSGIAVYLRNCNFLI